MDQHTNDGVGVSQSVDKDGGIEDGDDKTMRKWKKMGAARWIPIILG
jgi:hypothetical protein